MNSATPPNDEPLSVSSTESAAGIAALLEASTQALASGDHDAGLTQARTALAAAGSEGDRAKALSLVCGHAWRLGNLVGSYEAGHDALAAWNGSTPLEESGVLCTLSLVCAEIGAYGESVILATRAFDLAQSAGSLSRMAKALSAVGTARYRIGDHALGRSCLLRALAHAEEQNDFDAVLAALNNLCAGALVAHHDHDEAGLADDAAAAAAEAVTYARRAVAQAESLGDAYRLAAVTCNLGEALGLSGDIDTALLTLTEAESTGNRRGFVALAVHARTIIGDMLVRAGRSEAAVEHLCATLALMPVGETTAGRSHVHAALHRALKGLGRFEESLAHCEAALAIERRRTTEQTRTLAALAVSRSDVQMAQLEHEHARLQNVQLEHRARELEAHALHDPLTGLGNRRLLDRVVQALAANAPVSMAILDIDHFKQINDRFGHAVGDAVLRELAAVLLRCLRGTDTAVRLGGEEFGLVLMPTTPDVARAVCERVRVAIEATQWGQIAAGLEVKASLGVASWLGDSVSTLKRADDALYSAKRAGRNRVCVASPE